MKKAGLVILCVLLVFSLTACGNMQKAQEIYAAFGSMDFDTSLLNDEELAKLASFKEEREKLLEAKNVDDLEKLKDEWEEFSTPLNDIIEQYQVACDSLISDSDKNLLTTNEWQENNALISKIDTAFENRNAAALSEASNEYAERFQDTKEAFHVYRNLEKPSFSEKEQSILPESDIRTMQDLSDKTEEAFNNRDLSQLQSVQSEWSSFATTANADLEAAKNKMLNDWILHSNLGASFGNLLSFGIATTSVTIENHKIIYTTKYNVDNYGTDEQVQAALDSYLSLTAAVYQSGINQLQPYVSDICIRVEYLKKDGSVICYKEFS